MKPEMKNNILLKSALALAIVDLALIAAILLQVNNLVKDVLEVQNTQVAIEVMKERLERAEKAKVEEKAKETEKQETKIEESLTIDSETGWQVYRNETFGYEISYPSEWFNVWKANGLTESGLHNYSISNQKSDNPSEMKSTDIWIEIRVINEHLSLNDFVYKSSYVNFSQKSKAYIEIKQLRINNYPAVKMRSDSTKVPNGHISYGINYYIEKDDLIYGINMLAKEPDTLQNYEPTFQQIVDTFKFIDTK